MATDDFFRARLDGMVDPRHPLAVLGRRMPWSQIEASLAPLFARKARMGKSREDADMFGPTLVVAAGGMSRAGRPRLPIRLMVSLLYLKHAFNESDESVVERNASMRSPNATPHSGFLKVTSEAASTTSAMTG